MKRIAAAKFKAQCLAILDRVDPEGIVITKHGKPIARVMPIKSESARLIGSMKGKIKILGDTLSTGAKWDAES
jgi:prevent-host-death family protein